MTTRAMSRLRKGSLALFLGLGLVSCGDDVTGPSDLQGPAWTLESMEFQGTAAFVPEDPGRFTVQFGADGTIGVRADCNQCGGPYTLSGDRLTTGPLACTLVGCPTNRGQEFATLVDGASEVEIEDDGKLEIESSEGTLVLTR